MTIKQKDIKILWGRSGNRCAICKIFLTHDSSSVTASFTLGEQAHIVGDKPGSARSESQLTSEQRDSYHNLILLCPTHHAEIDSNISDWPVERLHQVKSEHELWVSEKLDESTDHVKIAKQATIESIVNSAVTLCDFENWQSWTSWAIFADPRWNKKRPNMIFEFHQKVISTIWPDEFEELKRSAITLSLLLENAANRYLENAVLEYDCYRPLKFYKALGYNPNYDRDLALYESWLDECDFLIYQSTKAANWFADTVRRDFNPMFFVEQGKFLVNGKLLEFSEEEKKSMPDILFKND
jgi:hypothetical protein